MFKLIKRIFGQEDISQQAIEHSSKGEYTKTNRLRNGGHGQEALDYMDKNGIKYNITKTYPNGVRVGNVPNHIQKRKKIGDNQSWFPKEWNREKIKKSGQSVAKGKKFRDGKIKSKRTQGVDVAIIRTNGKIATIFPLSKQKIKSKKAKR